MLPATTEPAPRVVAGFWQRYAAWSLDAAILSVPTLLLCLPTLRTQLGTLRTGLRSVSDAMGGMLADAASGALSSADVTGRVLGNPAIAAGAAQLQAALTALLVSPLLAYAVLALAWHVGFERSAWRASPGKRALRLTVADTQGARLPAGHAAMRFLACSVSWLTLNLGHAMAALPPSHLALHDRISGTRVLRDADARTLPAWAKGWIALQLLLLLMANVWLIRTASTAMRAMLEQGAI